MSNSGDGVGTGLVVRGSAAEVAVVGEVVDQDSRREAARIVRENIGVLESLLRTGKRESVKLQALKTAAEMAGLMAQRRYDPELIGQLGAAVAAEVEDDVVAGRIRERWLVILSSWLGG
jgi:peroxiredoxin family protein